MNSNRPDPSLPRLWCDFNAQGWTGVADDSCYYAFDIKGLANLSPHEGMRLFAFDEEGNGEVIGCEGVLEKFGESWRIRPDENTWFKGQLLENH